MASRWASGHLGIWAGGKRPEVGPAIAAAGPAGQTAVAIAATVKLTRVLLLAPVMAGISVSRGRTGTTAVDAEIRRPPTVTVFVLRSVAWVLVLG
jgi:uncharacterized membrane protein YadS